jgi:hypothetical protein
MTLSLFEVLKYIKPNVSSVLCEVSDNGSGPYISMWDNSLGVQPTAAAIAAAYLPATKAARIAAINAECRARLIARYGAAEEQVSRSLGIYGLSEQQGMQTGIAATVEASNTASDAVDAATTVVAVEAVIVMWPVI